MTLGFLSRLAYNSGFLCKFAISLQSSTTMNENPYMKLVKFILPSEMNEYFDLVDVALDQYDDEQRLHAFLGRDVADVIRTAGLFYQLDISFYRLPFAF